MIFDIADSIFEAALTGTVSSFDLLELLKFGFEGRHRILVDPPFDAFGDDAANRWLSTLSPLDVQEQAEDALQRGQMSDVGWEMEVEVRVEDVVEVDWRASVPRLPLGGALRLAKQPLRVVVENWKNDGEFLRRICPSFNRTLLVDALDQGWMHIEHGGGVGEMKNRVESICREDTKRPEKRMRIWLMFDSDIKEPGGTDEQTSKLENRCRKPETPVAYHRLQRRAIENYLPMRALQDYTQSGSASNMKPCFDALEEMLKDEPTRRYYYNMKKGFNGDRGSKKRPISGYFGEYREHEALQSGFGEKIWQGVCFHIDNKMETGEGTFEQIWRLNGTLDEDHALDEARDLMRSLLRRL